MNKRIVSVLVALLALTVLAGCAATPAPAPTTQATPAADPTDSAAPTDDANSGGTTPQATPGADLTELFKQPVKVGGLAPLTGELSVYGIAANNGVMMAFEEANAAGKNYEYIKYDEKGDATEAVNAYNKLISNDQVVALIGDVTTNPSIAVAQMAVKDGLPMITATGTGKDITTYGDNIFRACFIDPFQGEIMASYAAKKLNAKTAGIIYNTSDDYSLGLTEAFQATAKEMGVEVVATEGYNKGDVDFRAQLTNIAEKNPDVLFVPVYYEDVALIAAQAKEVGVKCPMLGADGWDGVLDKVDATNVSIVEGAYFCNHYSSESDDPALKAFVENYRAKYNMEPNAFAALGYDAANMMMRAIETAGSTDAQAIVAALTNMEYDGLTGHIIFDEERNPIKSAAITTITGGQYKFVEYYDK